MGNIRSRIINHISRPFREYNLQERAHKAVERNKYVPSPRHPSTDHLIRKTIQSLPSEVKESLSEVDDKLERRLRDVYVTSQDDMQVQPPIRETAGRPLPLNRRRVGDFLYGYHEPKEVAYGKTTLKSALEFISHHQEDPKKHTAADIAIIHKLDITLTEQVLEHFGTFRLMVPRNLNDDQRRLLEGLNASTTFFPNTPEVQRVLSAVAMKDKPASTDEEAKIPVEQLEDLKKLIVEEHQITLLSPIPEQESLEDKDRDRDVGMDNIIKEGFVKVTGQKQAQDDLQRNQDGSFTSNAESTSSDLKNVEAFTVRNPKRKVIEKYNEVESRANINKNVDAT